MIFQSEDILTIDFKIKNNLRTEINSLPKYRKKLEKIKDFLQTHKSTDSVYDNILKSKQELIKYIHDLENKNSYYFYMLESLPYIEKFKKIINTPITLNFVGKPIKTNLVKTKLIKDYLKLASNYIKINVKNHPKIIKCNNCKNTKFKINNESIYVCTECFSSQIIITNNSSYNDIDRINISSKYTYDRKIHFRDCINQYQAKQNTNVSSDIYTKLEKELFRHHILVGNKNTPREIRFKNVTKKQIQIFLKELGHSKHYENINLIHYNLTKKTPPNISHLETVLLKDFDILSELYDKTFKTINRKNFINTQYVLYQLLRRHKYKCKKEEFIVLKTLDRKFFHDDICKKLFEELGWNHTPFY